MATSAGANERDGVPQLNKRQIDFIEVFRHNPARVSIVASRVGGRPVGITISSLTSVSVKPPLFAISYSKGDGQSGAVRNASHVTVNLLCQGSEDLARSFASSDGAKFKSERVSSRWSINELGLPVLKEATSVIVGRKTDSIEVADAMLVIYQAEEVENHSEEAEGVTATTALLYCDGKFAS
ncbi:flavin reductase family protein [Corynebacterium bovis]|nr:flavin reductase [Corynebacterium bovis]